MKILTVASGAGGMATIHSGGLGVAGISHNGEVGTRFLQQHAQQC